MAKSYSILFVASEVLPFAKESGVGDVSHALPIAVKELGHDIRVMMPKYGTISERKNKIHEINRLREIPINMGKFTEYATIKSTSIANPRTKVQGYVATNLNYFDERKGVYHDPDTWKEYPDNAQRFIFFNKAALETCLMLGWIPDIIHVNDWQTALIPALIRTIYAQKFKKTKVVFTIHNFYRQGTFNLGVFDYTSLPGEIRDNFKHKQQFNFTKGGIAYSNYVTTVSPTHANEILNDKKYSNGLNALLKDKGDFFKGILNGIDTYAWNPARDEYIVSHYDGNFSNYKTGNKKAVLKAFGLDDNTEMPLLAMIPRIGYQKGTQLLIDIADELFKEDIRFVLLGEGDAEIKKQLVAISQKYPDKFKLKFAFDDELSHLIEAGADMFLMPSQYEPCGLNLQYSMAYGTVPIIRFTGGMRDIAVNFDTKSNTGNAITFDDYDKDSFLGAIRKTLEIYNDKDTWMKLVKNGMNGNYSWDAAAKKYDEIYRSLMKD